MVIQMKLCAIINIWNDWDLLEIIYKHIRKPEGGIDGIIIVASNKSNYGELSEIPYPWKDDVMLYQVYSDDELYVYERDPILSHPLHAETDKRNFGLNEAIKRGYTHFITMDADEVYEPKDILRAKDYLTNNPHINGLVVKSQVYFRSPTLTIGLDTTLVPFIHKITPDLKHEFNKNYPFAWEGKAIRIDPTRSLNINSGVEMFEATMHHYSWVRKDPLKKIRNSTAAANLKRSPIVSDLVNAKEGYFCQFYQKHLVRVPNRFGIPDYGECLDKNLRYGC